MKTALAILLTLGVTAFGQDLKKDKTPAPQEQKQPEKRKLQSVTWDLNTHKLVWVVQKGADVNGKFVASGSDRYEITPDEAVMAYSDEKRGFTQEEAESLHHLLDVLSMYCAESTVWWDQGQGTPLDKHGEPTGPAKKPETNSKPTRVKDQPPAPRTVIDVASLGIR